MKRKHNFKDRTGEKYLTKEGYWLTIINYRTTKDCDVQFENGIILYNKQFGDVKRGTPNNPMHPSVYGVGFHGEKEYKTDNNNKIYKTWHGILERGYSEKLKISRPTYNDCFVDVRWHNFQNFEIWMKENYNPEIMDRWQLDKDILVKGNKIYSPETCCFVPQEINGLFTKREIDRGKYPIGVIKKLNRYEARINKNGYREYQGFFNTPEEAFQAYKTAKEAYIKEVADKWKDQIDPRVYKAMYEYQVEITD